MRSMAHLAAALVALTAGCQPRAPGPLPAEEVEKVKGVAQPWVQAFNDGNVDGLLALYTGEAVLLPPGAEPASGTEEIRQFFAGMMGGPRPTIALTSQDTYGEGNLAYEVGGYTFTMTDAAGMMRTENGKYVTVYKKQADGSWKAVADMWSPNAPMMMPAAAPAPAQKK